MQEEDFAALTVEDLDQLSTEELEGLALSLRHRYDTLRESRRTVASVLRAKIDQDRIRDAAVAANLSGLVVVPDTATLMAKFDAMKGTDISVQEESSDQ